MSQVSRDADEAIRRLSVNHSAGRLHVDRMLGMVRPVGAELCCGLQNRGPQRHVAPDRGANDFAVPVKSALGERRQRPASRISCLSGHQATIRRLEPSGRRHLAKPGDNFWASESDLEAVFRRFGKVRHIGVILWNAN